ncbi:cytochrome-c peroxidase [Arenicella xantha]|uniref:Cytochrome c peroxidase n=1 Tax=Arenicella xantha TaxID=644221 RepID=A0A395JTD3_9GAMM|nr:cytochrome-c peroxidase [Arenicella xantha]RBP53592.1 cytochrome c peroxidase [Arenicella xantha]
MLKCIENKLLRAVWLLLLVACYSTIAQSSEPILPLPTAVDVDEAKAAIGKKLFFDTRLSADGTISCASCHDLDKWGAETRNVSEGIKRQLGERNSPTVFNTVFNFKQFWDGRADNLSHQALSPVTNPVEMGMISWDDALAKLQNGPSYSSEFHEVYGQAISKELIVDAIAEFEKTLITPNAPFDRYLRGDSAAINATQLKGYELFKSYGCVACHQGANVGGNMFQKFGVLEDISMQNGSLSDDLGRYTVTNNEWDKRVFKVPSLRLVTKTAPYFHNGSVATIQEAVDIMIKYQLGRGVPTEDRDAIIAFLESLVGEKPQGVSQ